MRLPSRKSADIELSTLLRHLEDVLIPVWNGSEVTPEIRNLARGLWERVVEMQDSL